MKSEIIKDFFSGSLLIIDNNNEYEYKLINNQDKNVNSECFKNMYDNFLDIYDKKNNEIKKFKKCIYY